MSAGQDIFDRLIAPIREQMMRMIVRIVGDTDDAADTLQAALMGVWDHLDKIQAHPNPHVPKSGGRGEGTRRHRH